jgi:hypothetical protein
LRNIAILAIFARGAIRTAVLPLFAMTVAAPYWIYPDRKKAEKLEDEVSLILASPMSLKKVLKFGLLFLSVKLLATLGQRLVGSAGFQIVSALGGLVSSASTTALSANMAMHGKITSAQAGMAVWCSPPWPVPWSIYPSLAADKEHIRRGIVQEISPRFVILGFVVTSAARRDQNHPFPMRQCSIVSPFLEGFGRVSNSYASCSSAIYSCNSSSCSASGLPTSQNTIPRASDAPASAATTLGGV